MSEPSATGPVTAATAGAATADPGSGAALPVAEVAQRLRVPVSRVHQYVRDGHLLSVRVDGRSAIPAEFLLDDAILKGLPGTITVLRDGGYGDEEILRWLFAEDASLPGSPIEALRAGRKTEVRRRAQALAF